MEEKEKDLYPLAYSLYQEGSYGEAKTLFQDLATADPLCQKYWIGLASCWQMEKHYDEALQGWAMASLTNDRDPLPHFHAAECLQKLDKAADRQKALQAYQNRLSKEEA